MTVAVEFPRLTLPRLSAPLWLTQRTDWEARQITGTGFGRPGRRWTTASLVSAGMSLAVAPVLFGPLGVAAGMMAIAKGDRWLGAAVSLVAR